MPYIKESEEAKRLLKKYDAEAVILCLIKVDQDTGKAQLEGYFQGKTEKIHKYLTNKIGQIELAIEQNIFKEEQS